MPRSGRPAEPLADLTARRDALRQAAGAPGADVAALLNAALAELDGAVGALAGRQDQDQADAVGAAGLATLQAERRVLHAAFQHAPVPLAVLERDGTIRRANLRAAELLGFPVGYATGRALTAFLDVRSRAAARSQLAAVARTGEPRHADCRVLTAAGPADVMLTAARVEPPGEQALLLVALVPGGQAESTGRAGAPDAAAVPEAGTGTGAGLDTVIRAMTGRLDLVTAASRLLLDNAAFSEAVTARRFARLLAGSGALATWVIVDGERDGRLRRQVAAGPRAEADGELTRLVRETEPSALSLPGRVHATGKPVLLACADDAGLLGQAPDGTPLLDALGVTSVICVPVRDSGTGYGTLTLARRPERGPFTLADLALAGELGVQLALATGVSRRFRLRSAAAEALQASLLPGRLPAPPGLEFAAEYLAAAGWQEAGADFYDVFRVPEGWAVAVGDVSGKGQDAAAMTAAARHAIRALTVAWPRSAERQPRAVPAGAGQSRDRDAVRARARCPSPAAVLAAVNDVLLAGDYDDRYVTVRLAFLRRDGDQVRVALGGAGHPGPAVLRADGRAEILGAAGRPLGLFADANAGEREIGLDVGDLMLFYTDGAAGTPGTDLAVFEDALADRLATLAGQPATDVVRAAQAVVTELSGGELRDDVTLLAVRVTALSPPP